MKQAVNGNKCLQDFGTCPCHLLAGPRQCSSIYDLPQTPTECLQRIANSTIQMCTVIYRSECKIPVCVYKALHWNVPQCSEELALAYHLTATLWNNLAVHTRKCKALDAFKKKLKRNIFKSALPKWRQIFLFKLSPPNNCMVYCFC